MTLIRAVVRNLPAYIWSGWAPAASLMLLFAVWELGAELLDPLALPAPLETLRRLMELLAEGKALPEITVTARRALIAFAGSVAAGGLLGLAAGLSMTGATLTRPIMTVLIGIPPIAWLVLALIWFGTGDATPVFSVFIACFPIVFVAAMQGARTLDGDLKELATVYRLSPGMRLTHIYFPHVVSYLFPASITALGLSWKVVVMAELLSTADGVGAALAVSRSHLDTATSMAWIVLVLIVLLGIEYLFLEPLKREIEHWREMPR